MPNVDLEKLLSVGAHFGHQYRRWNPKMQQYLFDVREGIYVFDLLKTQKAMEEALDEITKAASLNKRMLIVGAKKQAKDKTKKVAQKLGIWYVTERWLGGTLTNFKQMRSSIEKLDTLRSDFANAKKRGYTKKERLMLERKIGKLENQFGGILDMTELPEFMIIIDTHKEQGAVKEANQLGIPTVGIVDSNGDPDDVSWAIPMNDDAAKSLEYALDLISEAVTEGTKKSKKEAKPKKKEAKKKSKKETKKDDK